MFRTTTCHPRRSRVQWVPGSSSSGKRDALKESRSFCSVAVRTPKHTKTMGFGRSCHLEWIGTFICFVSIFHSSFMNHGLSIEWNIAKWKLTIELFFFFAMIRVLDVNRKNGGMGGVIPWEGWHLVYNQQHGTKCWVAMEQVIYPSIPW